MSPLQTVYYGSHAMVDLCLCCHNDILYHVLLIWNRYKSNILSNKIFAEIMCWPFYVNINNVNNFRLIYFHQHLHVKYGLYLWCLTPLSTIFQLYSFIGGAHRENDRPAASHWQTLSHYLASSTPCNTRDSNSQH